MVLPVGAFAAPTPWAIGRQPPRPCSRGFSPRGKQQHRRRHELILYLDQETQAGQPQISGCGHVHTGVGVSEDDRPFALRLARYCARNPLALDRLTYDPATEQLTYRSDKTDGPTDGTAARRS